MRFSIIVPVNNVKDYLEECVDSIINQDYLDREIILVDDGSDDGSENICDKYKVFHDVKVVHKDHGGLSSARNAGISEAEGEYLIFIDSDDKLMAGALSLIADSLNNNEDVLVTELYKYFDRDTISVPNHLFDMPNIGCKNDFIKYMYKNKKNLWPCYQYIVNRKLVLNNELMFKIGLLHEDIDWTYRLLDVVHSYAFMNKPWYLRRVNRKGSITNTLNIQRVHDINTIVHELFYNKNYYSDLSIKEKSVVLRSLNGSMLGSIVLCKKMESLTNSAIISEYKNNRELFKYYRSVKGFVFWLVVRFLGVKNALRLYERNKIW